jgi:hypothetical protein
MKRIIILSFNENVSVYRGVKELLAMHPTSEVVIPIEEYGPFIKSALKAVIESDNPFHLFFSETASISEVVSSKNITYCKDPVREVLRNITAEDVMGMVWEDTKECHLTLHSLEDFGLEMWDITDGLDVIEIDYDKDDETDVIYDLMVQSLDVFVENLAAYVTSAVLDVLSSTIMERMAEEDGHTDISPFDDDDL